MVKQKFRRKIRENVYEFVFAQNGEEALQKIVEHPDLDIDAERHQYAYNGWAYSIEPPARSKPDTKGGSGSAYGDMQNIRTAMNRGAFDFVCKPVDFDDLDLTMEKTISYVKQMHETMQAIKENNILKMYVDENVLNFMTHKEFESSLLKMRRWTPR